MWPRYLLWFVHEHLEFRHAEMESILLMFKIPIRYMEKPCVTKPYWIVELPSEECVRQIASRSILLKYCVELWARAPSESKLHVNLRESLMNTSRRWQVPPTSYHYGYAYEVCPQNLITDACAVNRSFKIEVETFNKHFTLKEKVDKIEKFEYLPLNGPVRLNNPDETLLYLEFYGIRPNSIPEQPLDLFFGRKIAEGQRGLINKYDLKNRKYFGKNKTTSQLALIMANQAQIRAGDAVLDPFAGSGLLLVAAAHFGGYVWGTDIDPLLLRGHTKPTEQFECLPSKLEVTMKEYGLESRYMDVVVSDPTIPMWRDGLKFDAIIADPPYGYPSLTDLKEEFAQPIGGTHLSQLYQELMHYAAWNLGKGKRLVCWFPSLREEYDESLPSHPCLRLVADSELVVSEFASRRLLTYEKVHVQVQDFKGKYDFSEWYLLVQEEVRRSKEAKAEYRAKLASQKAANT